MGKLSFKWRKNQNKSVSLYQIYLPKLHENILKYYKLDLLKEITIGFNYILQTTLESPAWLLFPFPYLNW